MDSISFISDIDGKYIFFTIKKKKIFLMQLSMHFAVEL
jgi:hypothetical protein